MPGEAQYNRQRCRPNGEGFSRRARQQIDLFDGGTPTPDTGMAGPAGRRRGLR